MGDTSAARATSFKVVCLLALVGMSVAVLMRITFQDSSQAGPIFKARAKPDETPLGPVVP